LMKRGYRITMEINREIRKLRLLAMMAY